VKARAAGRSVASAGAVPNSDIADVDSNQPALDRRSETLAERDSRNLNDLLQELRVAGLGVQVLFGFLLSLPFTVRFTELDGPQRDLYKATLLCTALSMALLISPVAYHRWVFRKHQKGRLLKMSSVVALLGLASVALAVSLAVWLIMSFVGTSWIASVLAAATSATFAFLWFAFPIYERRASDPNTWTYGRHDIIVPLGFNRRTHPICSREGQLRTHRHHL
jgi:O-antigen/teichoic acid export membrane protein